MILKIDNEFKKLIRPLNEKEYEALEKSIIQFGVMDTIKSWPTPDGELIVDGHNRFDIARKHGVEYGCSRLEFSDRDQAKMWILKNQLARRNMNAADYKEMQIAVTALLTKIQVRNSRAEAQKKNAKPLESASTAKCGSSPDVEVQTRTVRTAAKAAGVPGHRGAIGPIRLRRRGRVRLRGGLEVRPHGEVRAAPAPGPAGPHRQQGRLRLDDRELRGHLATARAAGRVGRSFRSPPLRDL